MIRLALAGGLLMLAACAPQAPEAVDQPNAADEVTVSIPGPDRVVAAGALPTPELDGVATTPGRWVRDAGRDGDAALFSGINGGVLFALRCDRQHGQLVFVRSTPLAALPAAGAMMKIITDTGATSYAAMPRRFAPGAMATVPAGDAFVATSLAQAKGRIGVLLTGGKALAMPADAVVGVAIRSCAPMAPAQSS